MGWAIDGQEDAEPCFEWGSVRQELLADLDSCIPWSLDHDLLSVTEELAPVPGIRCLGAARDATPLSLRNSNSEAPHI